MKRSKVVITRGGAKYLQAIYEFVREADSEPRADHLLDQLEALVGTLALSSDSESHPKELARIGIQDYRQVILNSYRIIYRVLRGKVIILLVADGRRDMTTLLAQRLLRGMST